MNGISGVGYFFIPQGAEDIAFWRSNRIRIEQQLQLGMIGGMTHTAGSVSPVAIVDDLSPLSGTAPLFSFGCVSWAFNVPPQVPILEIHAPATSTAGASVDVFLQALYVHSEVGQAKYALRVLTPSPSTSLALITATATELDDGWQSYGQKHQCRVFSGFASPGVALIQGTVRDAHGMAINESESWNPRHFSRLGLRIPRGKNLCVDTSLVGNAMQAATVYFGVLLREAQAPGGPTA